MKLLLVVRPFTFHGGVERATEGLVQALVAHGHDVHLASPPGQSPVAGVSLHTLPLPPGPSALRALGLAVAARRLMGRRSWDVVQSHERTLGQDVYRAGEGCHRAYLRTVRHRRRWLYDAVVLTLERRVFAHTPAIVAIARAGAQEIRHLYGVPDHRLSVVYNGVDLHRFHPDNRRLRAEALGEAGVPAAAWVVLFVGSGFERKGLATALEALAALGDRSSRLLVVGKNDARAYQQRAARLGIGERVVWLGPRPDVERWYAAADALVLPSRYEPFGNVHLEALASGVPVVTSRGAGGAELVDPGTNGDTVDPLDAGAVAAALARLRARDARDLTASARRSAEPFTFAAQVSRLEAIWRRVRSATPHFP